MEQSINQPNELSPFEHLVLGFVCEGLTNSAIAFRVNRTIKTIENSIRRSGIKLGIQNGEEHNFRVVLANTYRSLRGGGGSRF